MGCRFWQTLAHITNHNFNPDGWSELLLTSQYSVTRELLATDLIIQNHGQVTRTTPELALPSPNFYTQPTGGRLSLDIFNVHQPHLHGGASMTLGFQPKSVIYDLKFIADDH
ncbi:hypothetical protein TNCV_1264701 [Trichonephila clavipes]|nr:hypothetical protein TNCV_1264701 [Trichonephila clavipes]